MVKQRRGLWHIYSWFLTNGQCRLTAKERDIGRERERERENVMFQFVFRHSHMVWCTEVVFQCSDTAFGVSGIVGVDRIRWRQA